MKKNLFATLGILLISCLLLFQGIAMAEDAAAADTQADILQEAQSAYRSARRANSLNDYEQELKDMVAAGQLTQEQADALLKSAQDCAALQQGVCPSCGYEFSSGRGSAGVAGGSKGQMRGMGQSGRGKR